MSSIQSTMDFYLQLHRNGMNLGKAMMRSVLQMWYSNPMAMEPHSLESNKMDSIGDIGCQQHNSILKQLIPLNFNTKGVQEKRADQRSTLSITRQLLFAHVDTNAKDHRREGKG